MTSPQMPSTKNARTASGVSSRAASKPERSRRTDRNEAAMAQRIAVISVGGMSASASFEVAGNVPHSDAIRNSATYARV
jgi:hypothetical protein